MSSTSMPFKKYHFQKETTARQKNKISPGYADLPPLLRERQLVPARPNPGLPEIVVPLPQVARGVSVASSILQSQAKSLLTRKFRVAIYDTIGFRPIDCAFRD
jgi:hypothetical protein